MRKVLLIILLLILPASALADLEVHFLDVGQGDCAIIQCDGETMIIDGGPKSAVDMVFSYIRNTLKLNSIDYLVSTHPHVDHVGGLAAVLNAVQVDLLLAPTTNWDSEAFRDMIKYADAQGTPIVIPEIGDTLKLGNATVTILYCRPDQIEKYTNDASIVLRIDYENTSFLFTGDAEAYAEYIMLYGEVSLQADVLKVSHHGSASASSLEFLQAVSPAYAIISVGKENRYGHPTSEVMERLHNVGATILRTDELGTIVIQSDGKTITICN